MRVLQSLVLIVLAACLTACSLFVTSDRGSGGEGPVGVDGFEVGHASLLIRESFPVQVAVAVVGTAPTRCHRVVWTIEESEGRRDVEIFTEYDLDAICPQALEEHELQIELGFVADTPAEVWLNGELVGVVEG